MSEDDKFVHYPTRTPAIVCTPSGRLYGYAVCGKADVQLVRHPLDVTCQYCYRSQLCQQHLARFRALERICQRLGVRRSKERY
jgi:hypothetical protein